MKKLFNLSVAILSSAFLFSCTTMTTVIDDGYYSSVEKREAVKSKKQVKQTENKESYNYQEQDNYAQEYDNYSSQNNQTPDYSESYTTKSGNTTVHNYYFNNDDYYDYEYAARLRRFHGPYSHWGYYDPYYTNMYWYSRNPAHWGVSVY
ncbi:MAG: hypothetical protein GX330_06660, partial [Bacteroidales bacterium]|nr:hypothetical protein [Bacteroidales bacterium]